MPRKKKPVQPDRDALIALIPAGATKVKVRTDVGHVKYKAVGDLASTDAILTNKDDKPIVMKAKPGRKRKPELEPANATVAELLAQKQKALAGDEVLQAAKDSPESDDVLRFVMVGLADEAASISFERREAERKGEATSALSVRRVNALKAVVDTWLRRKEQIVSQAIDLESPGFYVLFQFIAETFKLACEDSEVSPEMINVVFARFSKRIDSEEWRSEAKGRMRKNL